MNHNSNRYPTNPRHGRGSKQLRTMRASCRKAIEQLAAMRERIFAQSARRLQSYERMLELALNEAESLAWQTRYPHLVFPELAAEKVEALAEWQDRQQEVRRSSAAFAFAE